MNELKEYRIGLPCMLDETVGRIVGQDDKGQWGVINDVKMFSIPLFCTPHGTVIRVGFLRLSQITDDGMKKLREYEKELHDKCQELYDGRLTWPLE